MKVLFGLEGEILLGEIIGETVDIIASSVDLVVAVAEDTGLFRTYNLSV